MSKADVVSQAKAQLVIDQDSALDKAIGAGYDGGFTEGVASVPPVVGEDPDEQAKIDAAVAQAVGPLNEQIAQKDQQLLEKDQKIAELTAQDELDKKSAQEAQDQVVALQGVLDGLNQQLTAVTAAKEADDKIILGFQSSIEGLKAALEALQAIIVPPAP